MKELNMIEFNKILEEQSCAFLCGNGFSCNFDDDFKNVFKNIYKAHKIIRCNGIVNTNSNIYYRRKFLDNYKSVSKYIKYINKQDLERIFKDAFIFAKSFIQNEEVVEKLEKNNLIMELTNGISSLDLVKDICINGEEDLSKVNLEYWTILVYFYFAIKSIDMQSYEFPKYNSFITLVELGGKIKTTFMNPNNIEELCNEEALLNGFITYYRILFSTAIYANGKAVNLDKLQKINELDTIKIKAFLNKFSSVLTLNYDLILDQLLPQKEIKHLHGKFVINKKECVSNQIVGLKDKETYISFSDVLIGDYFYNKIQRSLVNNLSKDDKVNKKIKTINQVFEEEIKQNYINCFMIFGMGIENDQHIIRGIMAEFFNCKVKNPKIIYCYYSEPGKDRFINELRKLITFGKELNNYAKNIEVQFIKTTDLIQEYFKS